MIHQAVQTNAIRSALLNGKTSCRIVKLDSFDDATILLSDTQVDTEQSDITANTIIHNETADNLPSREITVHYSRQTLQQINMK